MSGQRLSVALSASALVVAVLGTTSFGQAAERAVPLAKRALFADKARFAGNAAKVGGVSVSRSPEAGKLVPLGGDGKFSTSVIPPGSQGPPGPQGPEGRQGPAGPSSSREATRGSGPLSSPADTISPVATMTNIQPGAYAIFAKTELSATVTTGADCTLSAAGESDSGGQTLVLSPGAARNQAILHYQLTATFAQPGDARLVCRAGSSWAAHHTKIVAVRLGAAGAPEPVSE